MRRYEEDGAELWFAPETGLQVRIQSERTRHARRRVPRVVMFGITNRCNLSCDFCSRDASLPSAWTVEGAASLLEDLAEAGVLEIAFGGGEPFAFEGFHALLDRLHRRTPLALSVTTNGTYLTESRWPRFAGLLATVRISIYPEMDWRRPATVLREAGQRWGANVLVDDASLPDLPALLGELADRGATDVSILSYIGLPGRVLTIGARQRLARAIEASPVPCRLSVCMGDDVPVHRLWAGATRDGDCGAGVDFVSILPDGTMSACSFHDARVPVRDANDVLSAFLLRRVALLAPSSRSGCARGGVLEPAARPSAPRIAVWQGFSGNNSGECVLAAKFSEEAEAEAYLAALRPAWSSEAKYPEAWRELFAAEAIAIPDYAESAISPRRCPEDLGRIGRTIVATGGGLDDVFPELRALAFKRRARVLPGGIHVHTRATVVVAIGAGRGAKALVDEAARAGFGAHRHGATVLLTHPLTELAELEASVTRIAAGRPFATEVVMQAVDAGDMVSAMKQLGSPYAWRPRTVVAFSEWPRPTREQEEDVEAFASHLGKERHERMGSQLWFPTYRGTSRVAVAAMSRGAHVESFDGETLRLAARVYAPYNQRKRPEIKAALADAGGRIGAANLRDVEVKTADGAIHVTVATAAPTSVVRPVAAAARANGLGLYVHVAEADPLLTTLRRLLEDLASS